MIQLLQPALIWFGKNIGATIIAKLGWMGFKAYAAFTPKKWDDGIVLIKEGLEKKDFNMVESGMNMISQQWQERKDE